MKTGRYDVFYRNILRFHIYSENEHNFLFYYVDLGNENPIAEDLKRRDWNLATAFILKGTFMKALYESQH